MVRLAAVPLALVGLAALALAADLGAAAAVYGPEYVWRLLVWRGPAPHDEARFPARAIAASAHPVRFPADPAGAARLRAAFRRAAPAEARPDETLESFLARTGTTSLLVLRDGALLYEGYFNGQRRDSVQTSFSMAKSVLALLVGAAIAAHRLPAIDTPAEALLPQAPALRGSAISVRQLLAMTSGFAIDDAKLPWPFGVPWSDHTLMYLAPDLGTLAAAARPRDPPGTRFRYDDRNAMLLGMLLARAVGEPVSAWLEQRLWQPMGAEFAASWSLDSRAGGLEKMESGLNARPVDVLKLGQLVLRGGVADSGERLLPACWIERIAAPAPTLPGWQDGGDMFYGLLWWGLRRADGPPDLFAHGIFGQVLLVSRATGLVALRTGTTEGGVASWPRLLRALADALGPAAG
jgi:CubicO group peptidase (beta-lactamase class C family)